jgi:DNA-binding response OmpR family regulator
VDTGSKRTVLVVDDDAALRLLCRVNLEEAGFEVVEASDGDEALELINADRPDVILLDIMMPRVSGWQVAADLLNDHATDEIPIVFISALTRRADRLRAAGLGGLGYFSKPFDPAQLGPTLTELLDRIDRGERNLVVAENLERLHAELIEHATGPGSAAETSQ